MYQNICDQQHFSRLYEKYAQSLSNILFYKYGALLNPSDKVQDAYIKLWENFRNMLFSLTGERVFSAWQVPYLEPVMKTGKFKEYLTNEHQDVGYELGLCPNAERIQKSLMIFKTKYRNQTSLDKLLNGIEKTIKYYE